MRDLLAPLLQQYKLSHTHLTHFLDVTQAGPQQFLLRHLLRFPLPQQPSAAYGQAIHTALQRAHAHVLATSSQRPQEDILHDFETALQTHQLTEDDFHQYLQKGTDALSAFLPAKQHTFTTTQKVELNFADQQVVIGDARLTGKLDLVDSSDGTLTVTDYKTGRPSRDWHGKSDYEKIKLHRYQQQLMFYQLLVSHSRSYRHYQFTGGIVQFVEPTLGGEIIALHATFSADDLARFSRLIQAVWQRIMALDLPDISHYPATYKGILAFEADLLGESD